MMKKLVLFFFAFLIYSSIIAQQTYNINGETIELKTEVDGKLDLLWNVIDNEYRYFLRTSDNIITELVNTRDNNDRYQEEYKMVLATATSGSGMSVEKVNLTLQGLRDFLDEYNKQNDTTYVSKNVRSKAQLRLLIFGGVTNSPFVSNPENIKTPVFGVEFEVMEGKESPRHSGFLQIRHVLEDEEEFPYTTTEFSLGYRFRVIRSRAFNLFGDVKAATVNISKIYLPNTNQELSDTAFDIPFIFGMGADIRVSKSSFITLGYNQLFAAFLDNEGNFSTDVTIGYKLQL